MQMSKLSNCSVESGGKVPSLWTTFRDLIEVELQLQQTFWKGPQLHGNFPAHVRAARCTGALLPSARAHPPLGPADAEDLSPVVQHQPRLGEPGQVQQLQHPGTRLHGRWRRQVLASRHLRHAQRW